MIIASYPQRATVASVFISSEIMELWEAICCGHCHSHQASSFETGLHASRLCHAAEIGRGSIVKRDDRGRLSDSEPEDG